MTEDESANNPCGYPCSQINACDECRPYWQRMIDEGFWNPVSQEWTERGIKEMCK